MQGRTGRIARALAGIGVMTLTFGLLQFTWSLPAGAESISVLPSSGEPGSTATVEGSGYLAGVVVSLCWDKGGCSNLGRPSPGDDGSFTHVISIPSEAEPGSYSVYACQVGAEACNLAGFTVNAPPTATTIPPVTTTTAGATTTTTPGPTTTVGTPSTTGAGPTTTVPPPPPDPPTDSSVPVPLPIPENLGTSTTSSTTTTIGEETTETTVIADVTTSITSPPGADPTSDVPNLAAGNASPTPDAREPGTEVLSAEQESNGSSNLLELFTVEDHEGGWGVVSAVIAWILVVALAVGAALAIDGFLVRRQRR